MKKIDVMEALLDANSNVPASIISFVGANLKDITNFMEAGKIKTK